MSKKTVETLIARVVSVLTEFFPKQAYLFFPLISAAVIWAVRRPEEWKERIFYWKVWPDPDYVPMKPDAFIVEFFERDDDLAASFEEEIKNKDLEGLRHVFLRLYPLLGLEDPFLAALFRKEIAAKNFKKIVDEFDERVERARADIKAVESRPRFVRALKTVSSELASLGAELLSQAEVQKALEKMVKSRLADKK
jgi:hypothetical protein